MPWLSWVIAVLLLLIPLSAVPLLLARLWFVYARRTKLVEGKPRLIERPAAWRAAVLILLSSVACALYAWRIEPHWVRTTRTQIGVARPVLGKPRFKIAHLSDLHMERLGDREYAVLAAVRAEAPHLVVITGDCLGARGAQSDFVEFLKQLQAPFGVVGVGGEWDTKWPVAELFARAGARWLRDDYVRLDGDAGAPLLVIGQDVHPIRSLAELLEGASPDSYRLFLHHSPDAAGEVARAPVDLFLCGHTHGGQVRLPLYGGLATDARYQQGLFILRPPLAARTEGTAMYVNRGIGTLPAAPVRFFCRPEVAVVELVATGR